MLIVVVRNLFVINVIKSSNYIDDFNQIFRFNILNFGHI